MGVTPRIRSGFPDIGGKREDRKALANEEIIITGLAIPRRYHEKLMKENWWWCLVLLLGYTLPGLWCDLFHLSLNLCVKKKTGLRKDLGPLKACGETGL